MSFFGKAKTKVKQILSCLWGIVAILLAGAGITEIISKFDLEMFLIWAIICAAWNGLLLLFMGRQGPGLSGLLGIILGILLAPIMIIVNAFRCFKFAIWLGRQERAERPSGRTRATKSYVDEETDDRRDDNHILFSAMERAMSSVIGNVSSQRFSGYYGEICSFSLKRLVTHLFGISIYGSVSYRITNTNVDESALYDIRNEAERLLNEVQQTILERAQNAAEEVQEKYRGYDHDWKISVEISCNISE